MAICPRCFKEMSVQNNRMECICGYGYELPPRIPTYKQLIDFVCDNDYQDELSAWLEVGDDL